MLSDEGEQLIYRRHSLLLLGALLPECLQPGRKGKIHKGCEKGINVIMPSAFDAFNGPLDRVHQPPQLQSGLFDCWQLQEALGQVPVDLPGLLNLEWSSLTIS